jgi:diacylglycerol kinase (ATP)
MRRAGVLINPLSGRNNGKGLALAEKLKDNRYVSLAVPDEFHGLETALRSFAQDKVTDLFISSGDGTIQAILSILEKQTLFEHKPRICILPHGTTNLTAGDIGLRLTSIRAQAEFISSLPRTKTARRATVHVTNAKAGGPRLGFSFGAGAAATATRKAQVDYNDRGVRGSLASFATIAGGLTRAAFTKPRPGDLTRLDRPCLMTVAQSTQTLVQGPQLLFVATTLDHLFFRARPFWGPRQGAIRGVAVAFPPPSILRWAVPVMYGLVKEKSPPGCVSFSGDAFEITCPEPYVMDGEFFEGPDNEPLRVTAGPEFEFIVSPTSVGKPA